MPTIEQVVRGTMAALDAEKNKLLKGDFQSLPEITEQKANLLEHLQTLLASPAHKGEVARFSKHIEIIKKRAMENETLLMTARAGVSAAKARIQGLQNRERAVGVYGQNGAKIQTHDAGVSRRVVA